MGGSLVDEVEFITDVHYEESVWMKVGGGMQTSVYYIGCVYMPTDCTNSASIEGCYESLKMMYLVLRKGNGGITWGF